MKISVILPTYNEAGNIKTLIHAIITNIPSGWDYEILVIDDNSPDKTYEVVQEAFNTNLAVIPILRTTDRGLAKSIRAGIEKSSGDQILIMDTDLTHDPVEIPKMLHISQVYDIVSGSRFCPGGNMDDTTHYLASLIYNWCMRLLLRTQIQDNLGGFFTIGKKELFTLPFENIFFGYGDYFFRLLYYAGKKGLTILEIPAQYHNRTKGMSKSNFPKLLLSYSAAVIRFILSPKGLINP
jgi:dolichol-phosphate mannosyltransferase